MRTIHLTQNQGESLVDLLEHCDIEKASSWRHEIAAQIREVFGMCSHDQSKAMDLSKAGGWLPLKVGDRVKHDFSTGMVTEITAGGWYRVRWDTSCPPNCCNHWGRWELESA